MIVQPAPLPRAELDFQLSPGQSAKDAAGVLQRHERETASLAEAEGMIVERDVAYGANERQKMDICRPLGCDGAPCLVFIHGGFWQEGHKAGSGFAARTCVAAGWGHVGVGYTLAPAARLGDIVDEVADALVTLRKNAASYGIDPDRLIVAGHSAGGHLVAAIMAGLGGAEAANAVAGAVLISGVFELGPIADSYVNDVVGMNADDIANLSPMRARPLCDIPTQILIGGDESNAFQWQSEALHDAWSAHLSRLKLLRLAGRDHFDILDELADPSSPSFTAILEMVQ